jgi:hypothetical protein
MTDKPDTSTEAVERLAKFQDNATIYFVNRPTGGEDRAHWSNVANSETCEKTANTLRKLAADNDALRAEVEAQETNLLEQSAYIKRLEAEVAALADNLAHAQESLTAAGWEIVKLRTALGLNPMHAEVPNG